MILMFCVVLCTVPTALPTLFRRRYLVVKQSSLRLGTMDSQLHAGVLYGWGRFVVLRVLHVMKVVFSSLFATLRQNADLSGPVIDCIKWCSQQNQTHGTDAISSHCSAPDKTQTPEDRPSGPAGRWTPLSAALAMTGRERARRRPCQAQTHAPGSPPLCNKQR